MLFAAAAMMALGFTHAFGPDHLAAIAALAGRDAARTRVIGVSLRFALGHSAVLLACALLALAAGVIPDERTMKLAETAGGLALIGVGAASLHALFAHGQPHQHGHGLGTSFIGGILAVSGVRGFVLALPAVAAQGAGLILVAAFGLGVVSGMVLFGFALGLGGERWLGSPRLQFASGLLTALLSVGLGLFWVAHQWA